MDYSDSDLDLEKFEKKLFNKYREELKELIKENVDDVYSLTDGNLLESLILIKSFDSQEKLKNLTIILIVFTILLVILTSVLIYYTILLVIYNLN